MGGLPVWGQTCNINLSPGGPYCAQENINFSANSNLATNAVYSWDFGDGNSANGQNVTHAYGFNTAATNYTVTLTVIDSVDTCVVTQVVPVQYTPQLSISGNLVNFQPNLACTDSFTTTLTLNGNAALGPFTWDFGDGTPPVTSPNLSQTHTFGFGTHNVTVTANGATCPSAQEDVLHYTQPQNPQIQVPSQDFCEGDTIWVGNASIDCEGNVDYYLIYWNFDNDPTWVDTFFTQNDQFQVYDLPAAVVCQLDPFTSPFFQRTIRLVAVNPFSGLNYWNESPVNINYEPEPDFVFPNPVCWPDDSIVQFTNLSCPDLFQAPLSYYWEWRDDNGNLLGTDTLENPSFTFPGPGDYQVSLSADNMQCGQRTITQTLTINEFPEAQFTLDSYGGCAPLTVNTIDASSPNDITYDWSIANATGGFTIADPAASNTSITFSQAGTYRVLLTVSNVCGFDTLSQVVTVTDVPAINLAPLNDTCDIVTYQPVATVQANECPITSYLWDFGPNATPQTANTLVPPAVTFNSGVHTVTLTATNCCGSNSSSFSFTVYDAAQVSGGSDTSLCANDPTVCLTPAPAGGVWTLNGTNDSTGCLIFPGVGSYEVYYSYDTLGCSFVDTVDVAVNPLPTVDAGPPSAVCYGDTLLLSGASPAGGLWTGPGLVSANEFALDSAGTFVLTYTYQDGATGCVDSATRVITVNPLPTVNAGADLSLCLVNQDENLPTPSVTPTGGTFTWSGNGVTDPANGLFNPTVAGLGPHEVILTYQDPSGCVSQDTLTVTVIPLAPPSISATDSSLCQNEAPATLTGAPVGGVWTPGPGFVAPNQFDPSGLAGGSYPMIYTTGAGTSCAASDTLLMQVLDTTVVQAGADTFICASEDLYLPVGFSPAGGVWTGPGVINPVTGEIDLDLLTIGSTVTLTYTYLDSATGCSSQDQLQLTRQPLPTVSLPADTLYCFTPDTVQLPTPVSTGNGGYWYGSVGLVDSVLGLFDPGLVGVDTVTLHYRDQDGFCANEDSMQVYIRAAEPAFANQNDTALCVNATPLPLTNGFPVGGTWSGPGVSTGPGGTQFDPAVVGVGVHQLEYCFGVGSCQRCDTVTLTVNPLPTVDAGADFEVCQGEPAFYLAPGTPTAAGAFTWTGPNVTTVAADSFFFDPSTPGSYPLTYTYTDANGCSNLDSLVITVNPLPTVNAGPDTTYCFTPDTQQLPVASFSPAGGTGTWSGLGVVDASNGLFLPSLADTGAHVLTFCYVDGNGCVSCDSIQVFVIEPDSISAGPDTVVCFNEPPFVLAGFYPATGGTWTGPGIVNAGLGLFDPTAAGVGTHTLVYRTGAGSCAIFDSMQVTVQPLPSIDAQPDSLCISDLALPLTTGTAFGAPPAAPNTWAWIGSGVDTLSPTSYQFVPGLLPAGTNPIGVHPVVFAYTDSVNTIGCTAFDTTFVRVDSLPGAAFAPPSSFCTGDSVCLTNTSTDAVSYLWDFGDGQTSTQANPCVQYADTGTFTITLIATAATGCSDTFSQTVFISEPPEPGFFVSVDTACAVPEIIPGLTGIEVFLTDTSNAAGGSYFWDFGGGVLANGDSTSTAVNPGAVYFAQDDSTLSYVITLSVFNFCDSVSVTDTVTVSPLPQAVFSPDFGTFCSPYTPQWSNPSVGEPDSFYWYVDDFTQLVSTDSLPTNITLTYDGDDDTTYTVIMVAVNECGRDTATQEITVLPNDVDAFFFVDQTSGCAPLNVMAISYANGPNISWDTGDGFTYGTDTIMHTYTTPGTYLLEHRADNGCSYDTNEVVITVFAFPDVDFVPEDTTICPYAPVTFVDTTGTGNSTNYVWDFGDGTTANAISPTKSWNQSGTYQVIVNVSSTVNGCPAADTGQVVVLPNPAVSFTTPDTTGCEPLTTVFTNTSGPNATSFLWNFGDGNSGNPQPNPTHVYPTPGTYFAILQGFNAQGCFDADTQRIVVFPQPEVDFSFVLSDSCGASASDPVTATFTNLSTDTLVSYLWDFGDGSTSNAANPTHAYAAPDTYQVQLVVTSAFQGCADTLTRALIIYPQPVVGLQVDRDEGCADLTVNISNTSTNFTQASYDFGDGNGSNSVVPTLSHTYQAPGGDATYQLSLVVDYAGKCFDSARLPIDVFSRPTAAFTQDQDSVCDAPALITFTDQSSDFDRIASWDWDFGDGDGSLSASPAHTYGATGDYAVRLIVENDNGCSDTAFGAVALIPQPQVEILADRRIGCLKDMTVNFTAVQPDQATAWQWNFGDGSTAAGQQVSHRYTAVDTVQVILTANHSNFCFDADTQRIEIGPDVVSAFDLLVMGECSDEVEVFTANNSENADRYRWDFDDGRQSEEFNPIVVYDWPDDYEIELVAYNDYFQCSDTSTQLVDYPRSEAGFDFDAIEGCSPLTVQFNDSSRGATEWIWDFGDGTPLYRSTNPDSVYHTYTEGGRYAVTLVVTYQGVCADTFTSQKRVNVVQSPMADFDARPQNDPPGLIQFVDLSPIPGDFYFYDFGDGQGTAEEPSPRYQYQTLDSVMVTQVVTSSFGCSDTARLALVTGAYGLFVPDAFIPDGPQDEAWTFFLPVGVGLQEYEISVFNKWGNKVWSSTSLDADGRPDEAWNGEAMDAPVHNNVYVWRIRRAVFKNGARYQGPREGTVTVIR